MKRIYRSRENRLIAGICGGMGEAYGIDPTLTRLGLVFVALAAGIMPAVVAYIIAALIIPLEPLPEGEAK